MDIINITGWTEYSERVKDKEGLVCLGAGGNPQEWVVGITNVMKVEEIANGEAEDLWSDVILTNSSGGRTDISFVFNPSANFNMGKMAMWRLKFGDCSWISDFLVNYRDHYNP